MRHGFSEFYHYVPRCEFNYLDGTSFILDNNDDKWYGEHQKFRTEVGVQNKMIAGINLSSIGTSPMTVTLFQFIIYDPISKTIELTPGQTDSFFSFKSVEVMPSASFFKITSISYLIFGEDIRKIAINMNMKFAI